VGCTESRGAFVGRNSGGQLVDWEDASCRGQHLGTIGWFAGGKFGCHRGIKLV